MTQDQELSRLMMMVEQYKEQLSQLDMQISYLQQAINEYNKAKITVENLKENEKNSDILLPIGGGTYINANAKDTKKILFDIGAGYVVEKKSEDAIKKIEERTKDLKKNIDRIQEIKTNTQNEASKVYQRAQELYQEQNE